MFSRVILILIFTPLILLAQTEIRIGAILPLSGNAQTFGKEARLALENALADTPKHKFDYKLILEDDELSAAKVVTAAKKLIEIDKVQVIFSNWSYGGNAVASIIKNKPVINLAFAWDSGITNVSTNSLVIAPESKLLAQTVIAKLKSAAIKNIALIGFEEAGVVIIFNHLEAFAKAEGINIIQRYSTDPAQIPDYLPLILKLEQSKAEYLVTCLTYPQTLKLYEQLKIRNSSFPVASVGQVPYGEALGKALPTIWWSADFKSTPEQNQQIAERTGLHDVSGYPSYYEAMRALITVAEKSPEPESPVSAWLQQELENYHAENTLLGSIHFENRRLQSNRVLTSDELKRYQSLQRN